jgi:hypothetical protein
MRKSDILRIVSHRLEIEPGLILQSNNVPDSRKRERVYARQLCMTLTRKYTQDSLYTIGRFFGGHNHATVLYAVKSIQNDCDTCKSKKAMYDQLERDIDEFNCPPIDLDYIELTPEALSYQTNQSKQPEKEFVNVGFLEPARYREYSHN